MAFVFQLDGRAATFALIAAVVSVLLFGLAPAVQTSRVDLTRLISGSEAAAGGRRHWIRNLLVITQVAISAVLLVIASFMNRGFRDALAHGPGYRIDHLLMMTFEPHLVRYNDDETRRFYEQLVERARSVPGVRSLALASSVTSTFHIARTVPGR